MILKCLDILILSEYVRISFRNGNMNEQIIDCLFFSMSIQTGYVLHYTTSLYHTLSQLCPNFEVSDKMLMCESAWFCTVRCFTCTDADPATRPQGNWLTSWAESNATQISERHQWSATFHCWIVCWSVFENVEGLSLQFLSLGFWLRVPCDWFLVCDSLEFLGCFFFHMKGVFWFSMTAALLEMVMYWSFSSEIHLNVCV